jgi:hypothetical protein
VVLWLGVFSLATASVRAENYDELRVRTGARLLRVLLAADQALEAKAGSNHELSVLVYAGPPQTGRSIADLIAPAGDSKRSQVRGMSLQASVVEQLPSSGQDVPVALFLAAPLEKGAFDALLHWCIDRGVILYSPFEGDVERGATAGLSVQAKVQPFVNLATLQSSGIELRPFFLDHSRTWP